MAREGIQGTLSSAVTIDPQDKILSKPMTAEIPYTSDDLTELGITDATKLLVYRYDPDSKEWEEVIGSTVDVARDVVIFQTTKLGTFRLAAWSG